MATISMLKEIYKIDFIYIKHTHAHIHTQNREWMQEIITKDRIFSIWKET